MEVMHWFIRLLTQPTAHKEIRMKRKGAIQWFMKIIVLGFFFSCHAPEVQDKGVLDTKQDLLAVQKEDSLYYFKEFQQFRKEAKLRLNQQLQLLESLESSNGKATIKLDPEKRRAFVNVRQKIAAALKKLDEFNEEGKEKSVKFATEIQKDLEDLDRLVDGLENNKDAVSPVITK